MVPIAICALSGLVTSSALLWVIRNRLPPSLYSERNRITYGMWGMAILRTSALWLLTMLLSSLIFLVIPLALAHVTMAAMTIPIFFRVAVVADVHKQLRLKQPDAS